MQTAEPYRDRLIAGLRDEQRAAQARLAIVREQGATPDPLDRDVAGWLAAGLVDLLSDKVTGESFLKGIIARLANEEDARFTESDFQRPDGIRFLEASRPAQSMLTKLSLASTNQYRAAAARLMNHIVASFQVVVPEPVAVEPVPPREELPVAPPPVEKKTPDQITADLFVEHGLLGPDDLPADDPEALHRTLTAAWRRWFADRLALIDGEEFVAFEEFEQFFPIVARLQDDWEAGRTVELPLPRSERDMATAELLFEDFRWLRHEWTITRCTPWDVGPSFDAMVEAGGAPLNMLTKGVRYWLKENKDWKKYKIVKIEDKN